MKNLELEIIELRQQVKRLTKALESVLPGALEKVRLLEDLEEFSNTKVYPEWEGVDDFSKFRTKGLEYIINYPSKWKAADAYYEDTGEVLDFSLIPHEKGELWSVSALKMILGHTTELKPEFELEAIEEELKESYFDL